MEKIIAISVVIASCLLASCTQDASLQKRIAELESKVEEYDNTIIQQQTDLYALQFRLDALEDVEASLDLTDKSYSLVKSNVGNLLVSCDDIKQYGDGQKISLLIGNPYNMTFDGYTITAIYSRRFPDRPKGNDPENRKIWNSEIKNFYELFSISY